MQNKFQLFRDINWNYVFWSLKLNKLSAPQLAIPFKSSLGENILSNLDESLVLMDGCLGNKVEEMLSGVIGLWMELG